MYAFFASDICSNTIFENIKSNFECTSVGGEHMSKHALETHSGADPNSQAEMSFNVYFTPRLSFSRSSMSGVRPPPTSKRASHAYSLCGDSTTALEFSHAHREWFLATVCATNCFSPDIVINSRSTTK